MFYHLFSESRTSPATIRKIGCGFGQPIPLKSRDRPVARTRSFAWRCVHSKSNCPRVSVNLPGKSVLQDARTVEAITASVSLIRYVLEIRANYLHRLPMRPEASDLRMVSITAGLVGKDCLGEQPFAPKSDETPGIKIAGMEGPKAHSFFFLSSH